MVTILARYIKSCCYTCWSDITSGIPQGSVLDPILFSLYINDLPDSLHNQVSMFADDTKLFSGIHRKDSAQDISSMQQDNNSLASYPQS